MEGLEEVLPLCEGESEEELQPEGVPLSVAAAVGEPPAGVNEATPLGLLDTDDEPVVLKNPLEVLLTEALTVEISEKLPLPEEELSREGVGRAEPLPLAEGVEE